MHATNQSVIAVFFAAILGFAPLSAAQTAAPAATRAEIMRALKESRLVDAQHLLARWIETHPGDGVMIYNAACVASRMGLLEDAERLLLDSIRAGFMNFSVMKRDPDLNPIRHRPGLRAVLRARDAADDIISARRIRRVQERFATSELHLERDEDTRIDYLTALPRHEVDEMATLVSTEVDYLSWLLFGAGVDHRVLITIPNRTALSKLFTDPHVHGVYRHSNRELICDGDSRTIRHELVHALHHADMDRLGQEHPIWIQEGLACLFESADFSLPSGVKVFANERHTIVLSMLDSGDLLRWPDLFALDRAMFNRSGPGDAARSYAQVRSLFEFLYERQVLAEWYATYVSTYQKDTTGIAAIESVFGRSLEEVESEWRAWLRDRSPVFQIKDSITVRVTSAPNRAEPGTQDIDEGEYEFDRDSDLELLRNKERAAALFERVHPQRIDEYIKRIPALLDVTTLDPLHSAAHYDLGLAYLVRGEHEAAQRQREILQPIDPNLSNLLGSLMNRAR